MSELEKLYDLEESAGVALAASKEVVDKLNSRGANSLAVRTDIEDTMDNTDKNDNI